jgi:aspartyl-tRNA(Asn)/glutamyl-tRNA(Gln) amidotransferase subunit A
MFALIAGRDPRDPASSRSRDSATFSSPRDAVALSRPAPEFLHSAAGERKKFRLARPREFFWTQLDPEVRRLTDAALASLVKGGAELVEVSLPTVAATVEPSTLIALAEAREFHQNAGYFPARSDEYGADVRARLAAGSDVSAVDYLTARALMRQSRAEFEAALGAADADAIVAPASPIPAPPVGSEVVRVGDAEESVRSALVRLNRPSNFTGLPAISVPCGFTQDGLPVGLQLIGRAFDESTLLAIAHACEQQHDWSSSHPPLAELSTGG